jgi:oligoendopeptidase F
MQFLALGKLEDVLGTDGVERLRLLNLYNALDTLVWQSAYAEFEERAFTMAEPTVEKLNALMEDIGREYGLNADNDPGFKLWWIDVPHLFEQPFYVISYPVSACCALEIYEHELKDGSGLNDYLRLVDSEEIGIIGAAKGAGLQNPVTDERVRDVADFMDRQLAEDFLNRQLAA